jgi:hypothetical protein
MEDKKHETETQNTEQKTQNPKHATEPTGLEANPKHGEPGHVHSPNEAEPTKEEMQRASAAFNQVIEDAFESMWTADKEKFKNLSKKDLAHRMFVEGIRFMIYVMNNNQQAGQTHEEKNES